MVTLAEASHDLLSVMLKTYVVVSVGDADGLSTLLWLRPSGGFQFILWGEIPLSTIKELNTRFSP